MKGEPAGRLVVLMETWLSQDVPGHAAMRAFQEELGAEVLRGGDMGGAIMGLFTGTPGTKEALERAAEEMEKLEGMPV
ncbi:MAG: hypothetical protein ACOC3J_07470, partial [Gemmatimonadota bacterium]